ncbi:MAG: hypothetical protein LBD79_01880 [Treponema sp.]|jgi:hypothetical protein|nr:hypothetical protein [Treponema sp.]
MENSNFGVLASATRTINWETWKIFRFTSQERADFALNETAKLNAALPFAILVLTGAIRSRRFGFQRIFATFINTLAMSPHGAPRRSFVPR